MLNCKFLFSKAGVALQMKKRGVVRSIWSKTNNQQTQIAYDITILSSEDVVQSNLEHYHVCVIQKRSPSVYYALLYYYIIREDVSYIKRSYLRSFCSYNDHPVLQMLLECYQDLMLVSLINVSTVGIVSP